MRSFQFDEKTLQCIERERFQHPDTLVQRRMEILWLKAQGETHVRIAVLASVGRATVQRVLDLFWKEGLEAVRKMNWHQPTSALQSHRQTLEDSFREQPPHTIGEACDRIFQLTGVRRQETQVHRFLRETLRLRWRKVSAVPVPPKKSVEEHAANRADFLKDPVGTAT